MTAADRIKMTAEQVIDIAVGKGFFAMMLDRKLISISEYNNMIKDFMNEIKKLHHIENANIVSPQHNKPRFQG